MSIAEVETNERTSLRRLTWMAEGIERSAWRRTASLLEAIYNSGWNAPKPPVTAKQLDPFTAMEGKRESIAKANAASSEIVARELAKQEKANGGINQAKH